MGVGVQYKLISGMPISPDHSIGETTMFPEAFDQTLNYHPNLDGVLGDGANGCASHYLRVSMDYQSGFWKLRHATLSAPQ